MSNDRLGGGEGREAGREGGREVISLVGSEDLQDDIPQFLRCELQSLLESTEREVCMGQKGSDYYGTGGEGAGHIPISAAHER